MYTDVFVFLLWYLFIGFSHSVEILQTVVFFYISATFCILFSLAWSNDLKRFFFFSELAWLSLFGACLGLTYWSQTTLNLTNAFVVLIFTAVEAVVLACLLLIASESSPASKAL